MLENCFPGEGRWNSRWPDRWAGKWGLVSADRNRALILAYQTGDLKQPATLSSPVAGLDPACNYRVAEINLPPGDDTPRLEPSAKQVQSGGEWMAKGVPLTFSHRFDSAAVTLEAVTNNK